MKENNFEQQEKSGKNSKGYYQFGSNCCISCKKDRPLNEKGEWCETCINYKKTSTY